MAWQSSRLFTRIWTSSILSLSSKHKVSEMNSLFPFSVGDEMERFLLSVGLLIRAASKRVVCKRFYIPGKSAFKWLSLSVCTNVENSKSVKRIVVKYCRALQIILKPFIFSFSVNNSKDHFTWKPPANARWKFIEKKYLAQTLQMRIKHRFYVQWVIPETLLCSRSVNRRNAKSKVTLCLYMPWRRIEIWRYNSTFFITSFTPQLFYRHR